MKCGREAELKVPVPFNEYEASTIPSTEALLLIPVTNAVPV